MSVKIPDHVRSQMQEIITRYEHRWADDQGKTAAQLEAEIRSLTWRLGYDCKAEVFLQADPERGSLGQVTVTLRECNDRYAGGDIHI